MIPNEKYRRLYSFQDQVLELVNREPLDFYLTGGTALNRFHIPFRYSDDLDFFSHDTRRFSDSVRILAGKLENAWPGQGVLVLDVDSRDFKRFWIKKDGLDLKLDFVADRLPQIGVSEFFGNIRVDNVRNILTNKICAILGRDKGRDVADLIAIAEAYEFSWIEVLAEARTKQVFEDEEFILRLKTFPPRVFREVDYIEPVEEGKRLEVLSTIISDIVNRRNNTARRTKGV